MVNTAGFHLANESSIPLRGYQFKMIKQIKKWFKCRDLSDKLKKIQSQVLETEVRLKTLKLQIRTETNSKLEANLGELKSSFEKNGSSFLTIGTYGYQQGYYSPVQVVFFTAKGLIYKVYVMSDFKSVYEIKQIGLVQTIHYAQ